MDKSKVLDLILVEWIASLKSRDRSFKSVRPNFEDLFEKWRQQEASFDDLYETLLPRAIKAHQPISSVIKASFASLKKNVKTFKKTEKEFTEEWLKSIEDVGTSTFFEFFPPPFETKEESEPKVFGNMSAKEYRAQRKYADQFPVLDTTDLEKRLKEQQYNLDLEDLLKHVLGEQK
jgi:hypothetical protein